MAIPVTCRDCGASYQVADSLDGKKVRCRECDAAISVEFGSASAAPPPPVPPRRGQQPNHALKRAARSLLHVRNVLGAAVTRTRRTRRRGAARKNRAARLWLSFSASPAVLVLFLICGAVLAYVIAFRDTTATSPSTPVAVVTNPVEPPIQPQPATNPNPNPQPSTNPFPQPNQIPSPIPSMRRRPAGTRRHARHAGQRRHAGGLAGFSPIRCRPSSSPPANPKGSFPAAGFSQAGLFPMCPDRPSP